MLLKVVLASALCCLAVVAAAEMEELLAWKELQFAWPDKETKEQALKSGRYVPENNLPLGIERWNDKLFITVPRWKNGVGASLNYVNLPTQNKNADLIPYPDWKANVLPEGEEKIADNSIVSVFRVRVDACDRLWVMDTGLADIFGEGRQVSKPALVIFDLKTDKLIRRYEFKPEDLKDDSFFAEVVVDVTADKCDQAFAYVPDLGGYGIVVYSFMENTSWRIKHNFFHFDPLKGDLNVGGVNFQWTDGVFGLALGHIQDDGYRTLYFHPLVSTKEFSVSTHVLRNKTMALDPHNYYLFKIEGDKGDNTQSSAIAFYPHKNVLFLTQLQRDGVACWNAKKPLKPENFALVIEDKEKLEFTNDLKVYGSELYFLSDKMPKFLFQKLNPEEINYRIFKANINDVIKGTPCDE